MNLTTETFHFFFLTHCFSGGAEGKDSTRSELRIPPIRGHLRFWHREAFGLNSANEVWGTADGAVEASRVAVRLKEPLASNSISAPVLPHKSWSSRAALPLDKPVTLLLDRLLQCSDDQWKQAVETTMIWLLVGTLGYRASRAAGSVWPSDSWVPRTRLELIELLVTLKTQGWSAALVGFGTGKTPTQLRETASDTPAGPASRFGSANPKRFPSPVRFKVIRLGAAHCLLAIAPSGVSLSAACAEVTSKPKPARWNALGVWDYLW